MMTAPRIPARPVSLAEAQACLAGLPRKAMLRRAAAAVSTAARRDGQPGAAGANRNALTVALACLLTLHREAGR